MNRTLGIVVTMLLCAGVVSADDFVLVDEVTGLDAAWSTQQGFVETTFDGKQVLELTGAAWTWAELTTGTVPGDGVDLSDKTTMVYDSYQITDAPGIQWHHLGIVGNSWGHVPGFCRFEDVLLDGQSVGRLTYVVTGGVWHVNEVDLSAKAEWESSVKFDLGAAPMQLVGTGEDTTVYITNWRFSGPETGQPGDTDGDGDVDLDDLFAVRNNFGATSGATTADGDVDPFPGGDGDVDLDDLFMIRNNFGTSLAAVPEPVTLSLLCVGGLALLRRRSR